MTPFFCCLVASPVCKSIDWFHTWSDSSRSERSRLEPEPINRTSPIHTLKMWIVDQNLSCNRITGPVPSLINRLNQLLLLDLSYNRLSGSFPSSLQGLSSLQALVLKGNAQFVATIRENAFKGLKNLMILVLSNMNLQG